MAKKKKPAVAAKAGKRIVTNLKVGDSVMVLCGGNKKKSKLLKSQVGKILRILPKRNRVVVEGLNVVKRHKKALKSNEQSGIIDREGSVHISNVMYYREELKRPVRVRIKQLETGRKVRGFINPKTKAFEQIDV